MRLVYLFFLRMLAAELCLNSCVVAAAMPARCDIIAFFCLEVHGPQTIDGTFARSAHKPAVLDRESRV